MARPPNPHKPAALAALAAGESLDTVCARFKLKKDTVQRWVRKNARTDKPQAPVFTLHSQPKPKKKKPKKRTNGGKSDREERARKLSESNASWQRVKSDRRARAIPPIDRLLMRNTVRRLALILSVGLYCPICEPETENRKDHKGNPIPNRLSSREYLDFSKAYTSHLDKVGLSLEIEDRLKETDSTEKGMDYYNSEAGLAELAGELKGMGPRTLSKVLAAHPDVLALVERAVEAAQRKTG